MYHYGIWETAITKLAVDGHRQT